MPEIPECLQRRYKALDEMIRELSKISHSYTAENVDPGIKLMCNFWNILKDDPDCNLAEEVQQCFLPPSEKTSCYSCKADSSPNPKVSSIRQQRFQCFMTQGPQQTGPSGGPSGGPPNDPPRKPSSLSTPGVSKSGKHLGLTSSNDRTNLPQQGTTHSTTSNKLGDGSGTDNRNAIFRNNPVLIKVEQENIPPKRSCSHCNSTKTPLIKVLSNLEQAATFDSSCSKKLKSLLAAQTKLKCQIASLEGKEKEGVELMKEADHMWAGMEEVYKEKIAESLKRQNDLMKQFHDIEKSAAKWRKNKRDLEAQLDSINKCQLEMVNKINQKSNDLKSITAEVASYKKRIEDTKKEVDAVKGNLANKAKASDARIAKITLEITSLEKDLREESKKKKDKELAGKAYIQEARKDLQDICKLLLQRRLEHEDLEAEKLALIQEINTLKDCCDNCRDRCAKKQKDIAEEIKRIGIEIANYELKCVKCNVCVDSQDARTLCSDCPRCAEQRACQREGATCKADGAEECVCAKIKQMFLNNVLENMSTVLEKKVNTCTGKALGNEIIKCLNNSRNGKLNDRTRRLLQEFVLQIVKKNLNLTIVGGAVKTRCELDPETYKQLMLCLKKVKAVPPPKSDKGCDVKKDPCKRWGGESECNCPKGPKNCICTRKAPPAVNDPRTCPPEPPVDPAEKVICPHKNEPCGPECGAHSVDRVGAEVAQFRPDPCSRKSCGFGKNMRAAQCVLGPESLKSPSKSKIPKSLPNYSILDDQDACKCGMTTLKDYSCSKAQRTMPRELMIEEVMGGYLDVKPIDKVAFVSKDMLSNISERGIKENCVRSNIKTHAISNRILQTSSSLAKDGLKLVLTKSHEDIGGKDSQNKKYMFSRFRNGRAHQTELELTEYPDMDFTDYRTASGYLSANSSNNIKPLSFKSSSSDD